MDKDGSGVGPIGRGAPRARDAPGPGQAIVMRLPTVDTVGLRYILGRPPHPVGGRQLLLLLGGGRRISLSTQGGKSF